MNSIQNIFDGNAQWVEDTLKRDPHFFEQLSQGQTPEYLWIGCSDSRVPASEITNMLPGSIFVQRNIANQVNATDINVLSVIYYAVKYLKVKHILVVGHYGCGGVLAAMNNSKYGFLDNWLTSIKNIYHANRHELNAITDEHKRGNRLVELNVMEQVSNLSKISFIQDEWAKGNEVDIHGLVYSLSNGKLVDLNVSRTSNEMIPEIFQYR